MPTRWSEDTAGALSIARAGLVDSAAFVSQALNGISSVALMCLALCLANGNALDPFLYMAHVMQPRSFV